MILATANDCGTSWPEVVAGAVFLLFCFGVMYLMFFRD